MVAVAGVVSGAVGGAAIGILQWLVLRRQVSGAGWWVLASTMGWAVGSGLGLLVFRTVALAVSSDAAFIVALSVGAAVDGAAMGAITGFALVKLLRQPAPEA